MSNTSYPLLYQINTRVWLTGLSRQLGRPATLADIPETKLDRLDELGFDWVWLARDCQSWRGNDGIAPVPQCTLAG